MGIIDENWNYEIDIEECEKNSNSLFVLKHNNLRERGLKDLDSNFINIFEDKENKARNNDEELILLTKRNKELNQEIETKRKLKTQQKTEIENFKRDQKLLLQEVKETHEAFLLARKHYKKCLNIHYSIETRCKETRVIFIQFFTEHRNKGQQYAVYLLKNVMSQQYTLESINPTLKNFKELQRKLQETNDVSGILCYIRQAFLAHKLKDKDHY